jgi:hypothetical protein
MDEDKDYVEIQINNFFFSLTWVSGPAYAHLD